jgi:type II secretory pathway pseudopilin PulG
VRRDRQPTVGARGETLVELLASIAIMGIVGVVLISALGTAVTSSVIDRSSARGEALLRGWAALVQRDPYRPCTPGSAANPYGPGELALPDLPTGFTATVTEVRFWDGRSGWSGAPGGATALFAATCPSGGDAGAQRLALRITEAGPRGVSVTDQVVKRRP